MKLLTTKNEYVASNCSLEVDETCSKVWAWSYGWWNFVATDSVGNIFLNASHYSISTSGHQRKVRSILRRLGIRVDFTIDNTTSAFSSHGYGDDDSIKAVLNASIKSYRRSIRELIKEIRRKGSKRKKNAKRREAIRSIWYEVKDTRRIRDEYVGKKRIPHKRKSIKDWLVSDLYKRTKLGLSVYMVRIINGYKRYFKKQNGKVQVNELTSFLNKLGHWYAAPKSIDRIRVLFELKSADSIEPILLYSFADDLERMLPSVDSKAYLELKAYMKRMRITRETLTTLALDKIHTYLINKQNRRTYSPKEAEVLPASPEILRLEGTPHLKLIKTDQDLRREGREQSHCIGSKHYLELARRGYQALRYKGYTFFLSPSLDIVQTNGRHNSCTPLSIQHELLTLIKSA